jgi:hypothetical protein
MHLTEQRGCGRSNDENDAVVNEAIMGRLRKEGQSKTVTLEYSIMELTRLYKSVHVPCNSVK